MWNKCASACPKTCEDQEPICTEQCVPGCACPADRPYWVDGWCEEYSYCRDRELDSDEFWEMSSPKRICKPGQMAIDGVNCGK